MESGVWRRTGLMGKYWRTIRFFLTTHRNSKGEMLRGLGPAWAAVAKRSEQPWKYDNDVHHTVEVQSPRSNAVFGRCYADRTGDVGRRGRVGYGEDRPLFDDDRDTLRDSARFLWSPLTPKRQRDSLPFQGLLAFESAQRAPDEGALAHVFRQVGVEFDAQAIVNPDAWKEFRKKPRVSQIMVRVPFGGVRELLPKWVRELIPVSFKSGAGVIDIHVHGGRAGSYDVSPVMDRLEENSRKAEPRTIARVGSGGDETDDDDEKARVQIARRGQYPEWLDEALIIERVQVEGDSSRAISTKLMWSAIATAVEQRRDLLERVLASSIPRYDDPEQDVAD